MFNEDDAMSTGFDESYRSRYPLFGDAPTSSLVRFLESRSFRGKALELGCGDGRNTAFLLKKGFTVTALDKSPQAIESLRKRLGREETPSGRVCAKVVDLADWQWPEAAFSLIVGVTILDHLPAAAFSKVMISIIDALRPGGAVFFEVHTFEDPAARGALEGVSEFAPYIKHYFGPNELLTAFISFLRVVWYEERVELDLDHGNPHEHGFATLAAVKEVSR
ncbi:MAG: class I SAM-dependent methyltransferase [Thermoleophilia bacterium]